MNNRGKFAIYSIRENFDIRVDFLHADLHKEAYGLSHLVCALKSGRDSLFALKSVSLQCG